MGSCTYRPQTNKQHNKRYSRQKPTPPPTVEILDFHAYNPKIFHRVAREIADEPAAETIGKSPDLICLNAHNLFFYFEVSKEVKSFKKYIWGGLFSYNMANLRLVAYNVEFREHLQWLTGHITTQTALDFTKLRRRTTSSTIANMDSKRKNA